MMCCECGDDEYAIGDDADVYDDGVGYADVYHVYYGGYDACDGDTDGDADTVQHDAYDVDGDAYSREDNGGRGCEGHDGYVDDGCYVW